MRKFLTVLVLVPIAVALVIFALANREPVILSLDPFNGTFSGYAIHLPLFLVIFLALMIGVIVGGIVDWLRQGRHRRDARTQRAEVRRLEEEARALRRARFAPHPEDSNLPAPYMAERR